MPRNLTLHGASAGALAFMLASSPAAAQEALPVIDVGAATRPADSGANVSDGGGNPSAPAPVQGAGDRVTGYNVQTATSAKLDAPILQTPIAVQVVTRETLDDQPAFNINDSIVSNASSLALMPTGCSDQQNIVIRGFPTGSNQIAQVYRNGLLDPNEFCSSPANIQAVEVVKGPASVLYGRSEPGGLIDFITKQPLETPYYSVMEQAGGFGSSRTFVDATGPLTPDKVWLYRIDGEFTHDNSFVNYVWSQRAFGSAAIAYRPTQDFKANLRVEYQDSANIDNQPNFPAYGNHPAQIPINTYLEDIGFTGANPDHSMKRYVNFDWSYDVNKDWNITNRFAYNNSRNMTSNNFFACLSNPPYPDATGNFGAACSGAYGYTPVSLPGTGWNSMQWGADVARSITANLELKGKVWTGFFQHSLLVGTDHLSFSDVDNFTNAYVPTQINIFAPTYGNGGLLYSAANPNAGFGYGPFTCPNYATGGLNLGYQCSTLALIKKQEWQGFYGQDLISFYDDKIHVLLGGRYDIASAATGTGVSLSPYVNNALAVANLPGTAFGNYGTTGDHFFSPRVGVVLQPLPWFSIYGDYTESYGLNNGLNVATSAPLPSQQAVQWEGGVKAEFFDKKLTATAAFFDITKTNIATENPQDPTGATYDLLSARSRGVEVDVSGRINQNWSVIANFSHIDARVTKGEGFNPNDPLDLQNDLPVAGNRLPGVPDNTGNVWIKYDADGQFKGLSGAVGVSRIGTAQGDYANSFIMSAYTMVKLMAGYRFQVGKRWITAQINVDNLTNSTYFYGFTQYSNRFSMTPGAPRSVLGTLRMEF
jgi:iron complex outermembrane recepter protein